MKKSKKMLVALCLCVCVALSAGLVGCADSKTLAEIDDLKAKIEQKDTTIAEKDAEIEDKNAQIEDLTPSTLEKFGIMAARFAYAEGKSYIGIGNDNVDNYFVEDGGSEKLTLLRPTHVGSSLEGKISEVLGRYQYYIGDDVRVTGQEVIQENTAEDGTYSKTYMFIEYSKNKYTFSMKDVECAANDETNVISIFEEKFELTIDDGRATTMTREHRYQNKSAENQVDLYYWKGETTFVYNGPFVNRTVYSNFNIKSIEYTTNDFNLDVRPGVGVGHATIKKVACFSGKVVNDIFPTADYSGRETKDVVLIDGLSNSYGYTFGHNDYADSWGGSNAYTLDLYADKTADGAFKQMYSIMGKKIYEVK